MAPNLNLLGWREPHSYGSETIQDNNRQICKEAEESGAKLSIGPSNPVGKIVDSVAKASSAFEGILINSAAYTHTSIAICDALPACPIPVVEVHLSNIYKRRRFADIL